MERYDDFMVRIENFQIIETTFSNIIVIYFINLFGPLNAYLRKKAELEELRVILTSSSDNLQRKSKRLESPMSDL